ncbi:MAG: class I SAM-dependent methyltransferase [Actinomycetia bacterium]|nr:class I SAM-dependent methyltransferase [Actinomycetes bacterium]
MSYSFEQLQVYLQWDISTWQRALVFWDEILAENPASDTHVLELGTGDGGLTLYLAEKGMDVVCSDVQGPNPAAYALIQQNNLSAQVSFAVVDATAIDFADNSFQFVLFKSVLGGVGMTYAWPGIEQVIREIHRVLKPGGWLLFAENLAGSAFHRRARRMFMPWGKTWLYPSLDQLETLLAVFAESEIKTYGFFSCIKKDFAPLVFADQLICRSNKASSHYMAYGYARKA